MFKLKKEQYYGNIEYKLKFSNITKNRFDKLSTQLKFRLIEGDGIALYFIGVNDNGELIGINHNEMKYSLTILKKMCKEINAIITKKNRVELKNNNFINIIKIKALFDINNIFLH